MDDPETKAVIEAARDIDRQGMNIHVLPGLLLALRAAISALDAAQAAQKPVCKTCGDTGLILEHPADVPFSQSLAAIGDCPDCGDGAGTKSSGEVRG